REPGYVPRPRNAFIVFRSYYIEKHRDSGEVQQNELSKAAGRAWKSMTDEEKREFKETADKEQAQHKIEHPNYQYAP
ncbi:HMG-box, partial [Pholiota conissans]